MSKRIHIIMLGCVLLLQSVCVLAQSKITMHGKVIDADGGFPISGVSVVIKDNSGGTVTDESGQFQLEVTLISDTATLLFSHVSYESKEVKISSEVRQLDISLVVKQIVAHEIVVTASRVNESILEAPVSIVKMDAIAVKDASSENFYSELAHYKGVDVLTNSLFYKTINTRGFNASNNLRVVALIDGMDNSLVGLGWPLGNVLGITDLDVEKVELISGPASALYGANAYNGLLYTSSKDPFIYQGLSVQLKNGVNQLGNDLHEPAWYSDMQLRYAKAINNRLAFKVNFGYMRGSDWLLTDSSDIYPFAVIRGPDDPARDAVNIYGDEVVKAIQLNGSLVNVSRTGYYQYDLFDDLSYSLKANAALHYKFNNDADLSYQFSYARATTAFQSTFSLKNISTQCHKIELAGRNFYLRGYLVKDNLGDTYNAKSLAPLINDVWKDTLDWFADFQYAYNGEINGVDSLDVDAARNYADSGRLVPGSESFNHVMDSLIQIPLSEGGAKVIDHSQRYHLQGEYDLSRYLKIVDFIAGAEYRLTNLKSEGTIFYEDPLYYDQFAFYGQASKKLFKEHLKLLASIRYDKVDNFKGVWSPRVACVFHFDEKNYFRASYQTGFRLPDPQAQFIDIDFGYTHRLGATAVVDELYHVFHNSFTYQSFIAFINAGSINSAGLLEAAPYDYIEPEKIQTFEIGYQRLLFQEKIYTDIAFFHNDYTHLIGPHIMVKTGNGGPGSAASVDSAASSILNGDYELFFVLVNSTDEISEDGIEAGLSIMLPSGYLLSSNFTYVHSDITPALDVPGIRSPKFKTNVTLSNRRVFKNAGFSINWRWTDYIPDWNNLPPLLDLDNSVPATNIIDAQINYRLTDVATTMKIGASNVFNHYYQDNAQGIAVGGIYYVSLLYDGIFK